LLYALSFPAADMHGVWAGLTPRQLAKEQKTRGIKPTKPTIAEFMADMLRYYKEDPQFRDDPPQPLEDYNFDD
jgi:hypothetical protein